MVRGIRGGPGPSCRGANRAVRGGRDRRLSWPGGQRSAAGLPGSCGLPILAR